MINKLQKLVLTVLAMFVAATSFAQFTTSSLNGQISDAQGTVPGATVIATHTPSGTQYYTVSNEEGRYAIQGMRPGGPYEVSIQLLGYQTVTFTDITLPLGETVVKDASLKETSELLDEVVFVATRDSKFSTEKTGASTNVNNSQMMNLPNSDRSISALTKLSPYANGMSFAGGDGRSTNFTVDGANFNNNFGLSANLPGGGTPISLDAIEEVQLVVAPYDVRQSNFVGGGINAITKSGTNTFKGTVYGYYHDENLRGNKIAGEDLGDRKSEMIKTIGATIGGPIIKNKLFFFANFEMNDQPEQAINTKGSGITDAQLEQVKNKLVNDYGYDPGSYTDFPGGTSNMKILARIDWNITTDHKLSVRYNNTQNKTWYAPNGNSCDDKFRNKNYNRASEQAQPFSNNMYSQQNNVTSVAAELNSRFGSKTANQLIATYSFINDQRGTNSDIFPHVDIMDGKAGLSKGNYIPATSFGYELFTYKNGVTNKIFNITDNFTYYAGNHKITAGANFEHQFADNSYIRNGTGYYRFASVDDFLNGARPLSFALYYAYDNSPETAQINYNQAALYVQDDWNATKNFKLNYGIRLDTIMYDDDDLITNKAIKDYNMGGRFIDTGHWPATTLQVNPRLGFVWDVKGDKTFKIRGGSGLFQGRLPLVFFTNMPTNSGMILNQAVFSGALSDGKLTYSDSVASALDKLMAGGKMTTDMDKAKDILGLKRTITEADGNLTGTINGVDPNFKMPQVWKTSLAFDWTLPTSFPMSVTAEGIFNKTIYGVRLADWNLNDNVMADSKYAFDGPDKRTNYRNITGGYSYGKSTAYVLTNTNDGYGWIANITLNATPVRNLDIMAAYTHTVSKEVSGMPGSNATSAYTGLYTVNGTNLTTVQNSQYVVPDKVMANVSYFIPVFDQSHGLHLNLYYSGFSRNGYSYVYSNDMNGDGNAADLIYIPANKNEIQFTTDADRDAFWKFVEQDKYLSSHKGQYAEAYSGFAPWTHRFDARIAEDFSFHIGKTDHNFQLSVSIDNIGNMINSDWGAIHWGCYTTSTSTYTFPVLTCDRVENNVPVYSMVKVNGAYPTESFNKVYRNPSQCWQILVGLKYFFN